MNYREIIKMRGIEALHREALEMDENPDQNVIGMMDDIQAEAETLNRYEHTFRGLERHLIGLE